MINRGGTLSGNERNCGFLNLGPSTEGTPRFATISNVSGVDFNDDGRSYCLTDWDRDGDVDVLTMNRTAPRVRFLRNSQSAGNAFIGLRLTGVSANRDAIGARVEVHTQNESDATTFYQKTLRAGEGFLSQSSKWLHFGLGDATRIVQLKVHWPGRETEQFSNVGLNQYLDLKQNSGRATKASFARRIVRSSSKKRNLPEATSQAHVLLTSRIPAPRLAYRDENSLVAVRFNEQKATLINLWAHWCIPCQQELAELNQRERDLASAGIKTIALSVDGISNREGVSNAEAIERANRVMSELNTKFSMGFATKPLLHRLQFLDDLLFSQKREIAIPTSFLFDRKGRLAAIFRGRLNVDRLIQTSKQIDLTARELYDASMPFPGFWFRPKQQGVPLQIAIELRRSGHHLDAAHYLLDHSEKLVRRGNFVQLAGQLGATLAERHPQEAIALMRVALEQDNTNIAIMNNLAWHLSRQKGATRSELVEASKWAMAAAKATRFNSLPVLDTLIEVQLRRRQFSQAKTTLRHALKVAQKQGNAKATDEIQRRLVEIDGKR